MPVDEFDGENGSGSDSDDPDQSRSVPKILSQRQDDYAPDPESVVEGTPLKKFDKQEGLSGTSNFQRYSVTCFDLQFYFTLLSCNTLYCDKYLCRAQEYSGYRDVKHNFRYHAHPCSMSIICPLLHCQCVVCSYFLIVLILTNNILYCMQECTGFRDVKHNFRYHCMLAVSLSLPSFCECNLLLSFYCAHFSL